jgi:two-component system OmpR family response regulator
MHVTDGTLGRGRVNDYVLPVTNGRGTVGRLLVVEDDDRIARLVVRALESDGHSVDREPSGMAGLKQALAGDYDLVVLDLMLPDMDGTEVMHRLLEARPEQRVLVVSAVPEIGARVACLEGGATDFLPKPFVVAELLARVRARLRTAAPGATGRWIAAGVVRLDLRLRRAVVAGRQTELSFREFLLLQHLMRRCGQACSRTELLADVWGLTFDPGSNVVDVCVRRLRGKLDQPGRIETVRNVGYRFIAA